MFQEVLELLQNYHSNLKIKFYKYINKIKKQKCPLHMMDGTPRL